jgi:hypothetical protein|tara:strand:- start:673 stop:888 length:216 start_codon:yes stop_codon:yes gene_type:complete
MARSLKLLESLPIEFQEAILEEVSLATQTEDVYKEINIDGNTYVIHKTVLGLIDGLVIELEKMKNEISANK